ncbi:unnamed protein product, partial [Arabidopsis halleri]
MNNPIEDEVYESSDTDTSIESDPSECSEEAEDVTMNQDSQLVEIECDEASHVQWMIDEEGQMYAEPLGEFNEDQVEDSLNNMLSQFYVVTSDGNEDMDISEMGTIGEYGLGLSASMTALFEVPMTEEDGALGAENEHEAERGVNEAMGDDEALELELEHAIDQLIAEFIPEVMLNVMENQVVVQQDPQEVMGYPSGTELWPELEMFKGNESSIEERQDRWDPMMLEQELNHESLMKRLQLDEGKLKNQVTDNMEVDGKSKGKRVAEPESEQRRIKDRRIIAANPHPLGVGYGVMSKVKPRIRATARKSVGGRRTSPVKTSPPCGACSRTDHPSGMCPYAHPVQPYMVEYVKCYCCGGVGHVSMYCPYTATNVGEGSSRGAGPSATVATEEKCLNE